MIQKAKQIKIIIILYIKPGQFRLHQHLLHSIFFLAFIELIFSRIIGIMD